MDDIRSWWEVPSIAHFCSLFRSAFDLTDFDIEDLENGIILSSAAEDNFFVTDLLCQLLQGCYGRKDISRFNFELYLKDILKHRWEVEQQKPSPLVEGDFKSLSARQKVEILHSICDYRLDALDVPDLLKGLDASNMRVDPLGQDGTGATYWYFYGTRLYREDAIPDPPSQQARKHKKKAKSQKPKGKRKAVRKRRGKSWTRRKQSAASNNESESESGDEEEPGLPGDKDAESVKKWHLICTTLEEWQELAERFEKSKVKCERELHQAIVVDFLPEIPILLEEKEKELRKKLLETAPRRTSSRLETKRQHDEPENNEEPFVSNEKAVNLQMKEIERQQKEQQEQEEKENARQERARRLQLREERAKFIADGKDIPPELLYMNTNDKKKEECRAEPVDAKTLSGMLKVIKSVRSHKAAWPFCEPVQESFAPSYFEIIKHPMDISTMEKKVRGKEYKTRADFIADFRLMARNCHKYNGPDNEYSEMVNVLEKWFNKAVRKFIPKKTVDSDAEYKGGSTCQSSMSSRPSRAASSRALEALHQAAAEALQASSSANSSSDDLSGDEISGHSSKPSFVIKMEPFPGSSGVSSVDQQQSRLGHRNSQLASYGSQMNASNVQVHDARNSVAPDVNSMQQNYSGSSNEQPFSFTAMLQGTDPPSMFDAHANNSSHQLPNNHLGGYPGHENVPGMNHQQYSLYNRGYPQDNQVMHAQQFHGHSQYNGETIDRGALNQLSFSSANQGYPMTPGMQHYHGMGNQGTPWGSRQQGGGNLPAGTNSEAPDGQPAAPRPEQPKSSVKLGGGMGHALPQLPAPRTSRVQLRPKAPSAVYSGPGCRPFLAQSGPEAGQRPPGDPFSLLKKNIREMEQKDQSRPETNPSQTPQSMDPSFINRCYDNISPADSLPGTPVSTDSEVPKSNSSTEDGAGIRINPEQSGHQSEHLADVHSQQKLNGQGSVPITNMANTASDDGPGKTGIGESQADALADSLESTGSDNEEDSEEDGEDLSDFSPKKEVRGQLHYPPSSSDSQLWNSKGMMPSPALQGPPPGNVTVMAGGGFQTKRPGEPIASHENQLYRPAGDVTVMAGGEFQAKHPGEPSAVRESHLYGPPGNVTVMAGGGFQVKHPREPNSLHPVAAGHGVDLSNASRGGYDNASQQGSQRSAPSTDTSHHGKKLETNPPISNSQQEDPNDISLSRRQANAPESTMGIPFSKPPDNRSPSDMYDFRSSIMEQAKLKQQDSAGVKSSQLPMMHPAHQAPNPYDPTQAMYGSQFYPGVDYSKRDQQSLAHQQLPLHPKVSTIPLQSQPLKKRKLYENVEQDVPATPPSKIWRPGVDPSSAPASTASPGSLSINPASEESKNNPPREQYEQKTTDSSSEIKKVSPPTSVKLSPTSSGNPVSRDSSFPGRSSPHVPHAQAMSKQALSLAHLKQENGKASLSPKPEPVNSPKHMAAMAQPSLSTSTHPTFVTVPGLAQPGLYPQGHPGAMPTAQPQMAMMGLPPTAFPYYHPYMLQQRHAELEMQKHMHENGLFYHQQLMQSSQHGFPGYQQFSPHLAAAAQQKLLVPENSAQQRLLAHLAQTHRANGLLHPQFSGAGRPPHP